MCSIVWRVLKKKTEYRSVCSLGHTSEFRVHKCGQVYFAHWRDTVAKAVVMETIVERLGLVRRSALDVLVKLVDNISQ